MNADRTLTEAERFPLLTAAGRKLLHALYEHPSAPKFNHRCGDRLTAAGLQRVQEFEAVLRSQTIGWQPGTRPAWVDEFVRRCVATVPHYRKTNAGATRLEEVGSCRRADLGRAPWSFVPDDQTLDDLIVYNTSGTTGHPLDILCHPEVSSTYLPILRVALERHGITLTGGPDRVAILLVCHQRRTYTYASISSYLDQAGFAKVNLHVNEWRNAADRARFLDDYNPEIYTGDPLAFHELSQLPLSTKPKALVSTAMKLQQGLRARLEKRFGCPVVDLYSLNESGPVAVAGAGGFELLPHDTYVEVLDEHDQPCPPDVRGEVTLTGGRNPFLPLLRYRTGDCAGLTWRGSLPVLVELEGRQPTTFRAVDGNWLNNVDVSWALKDLALPQFTLRQDVHGKLTFATVNVAATADDVRGRLATLFGADQRMELVELDAAQGSGKVIQYQSDLSPRVE